ncbi:polyprenyl synthetase family protein [Calycomorphotria hydatis]|uniref:Farnesyl diphosphate synthase n=1 Tax=Calycomorphotria hydatis TaxID=2528027 RepID=A0A517TD17_9PLAN|nr:farnesyl diphosphate synthase [Calycomorphotria hydatis]QDT66267.1 Farnesyl diphosphate synthase [Calycomorphotria hydatis]
MEVTAVDRITELKAEIEHALAAAVEDSPSCPPRLAEAIRYSLMAGGKRLRPTLTLLACEACGGSADDAMPAAVAVEMIHTYSLIHDDLPAMDDDDLRRGRPTNHKVFGEAMAILAGDALLTAAFEILAKNVRPGHIAAGCCADLAAAAGKCGMVGGQVADLEAETATDLDGNALESIHRRKTGALLTSAVVMGGRIANADAETLERLRVYGNSLGLAFQIADDLLDITGNADKMGKGVQKDSAHGKLTYPALYGIEASQAKAVALIEEARQAIAPLGEQGSSLDAIARFVVERDH